MEEDIKILENYLHTLKKFSGEEIIKSDEIIKFIEYKEIKAIENLIKGCRELEGKYNKLFDKYNDRVTEIIELEEAMKRLHDDYRDDYIPTSKIKEKIEELELERNKFGNCKIEFYENELIDRDIRLLQELMEDK